MDYDFTPHYAEAGELAFPRRASAMPWAHRTPLPPTEIGQRWQQLQKQPRVGRKGLAYVHIPFCANHCLFCGFYANRWQEQNSRPYTNRLIAEIETGSQQPLTTSSPIHAVYLGGGTPSALAPDDLFRLIQALRQHLPLTPDAEITVEGRIQHFDGARIDACLAAGANRFSIGVQSFDSTVRQQLGRKSDRRTAITFLERLAARDQAAVVCDLIFGLPGQDEKVWQADLDTVCALPVDGVDLYSLALLPSAPLAKAVQLGRRTIAGPTQRLQHYLQGHVRLAREGWMQLSNSHWARTTRERNLYNQLIKQGADCLAFGSGAGGHVAGLSYVVQPTLADYEITIDRGEKPLAMMALADGWQPLREAVIGGIEAGRLDLAALPLESANELVSLLAPLLSQWQQIGLLEDAGAVLRLTPTGRFWANNLHVALNQVITTLPGLQAQAA